jgi:hypothetical protein
MMQEHPRAVAAVLQEYSDLLAAGQTPSVDEKLMMDVTSTDLQPLVAIRRAHQTIQAERGVRNYKPPDFDKSLKHQNVKSKEPAKELSDEQKLARQINSILLRAEDRGPSTGLNRNKRWGGTGAATAAGNAANAELAAKGRALEVSLKTHIIYIIYLLFRYSGIKTTSGDVYSLC